MRKAVAKLTLIRRFNKNWDPDAYGAQTNTGSSNTMISSKESNSLGGKRRLFGRKQRNLGRTMDNYVKEQSNLYEYARQRKATNDQKLPWYILTPASSYKLCWDIVILFLVIWAAVRVPIRIGFDAQPGELLQRHASVGGKRILLLVRFVSLPFSLLFFVQAPTRSLLTFSPTRFSSSTSSSTFSRQR